MFKKSTYVLNGVLLLVAVGILAGCSSAAKKPVGAHARAEKGMTTKSTGNDGGPFEPSGRPTGTPIPWQEFLQEEGESPTVCNMIHFDYDQSDIKDEYKECLNNIASVIKKYPNITVIVEGHCDERGTPEYNLALGERRAQNTVEYLISQGAAGGQFTTRSWGEERPLELCSDESCWKVNRRAEFMVLKNN